MTRPAELRELPDEELHSRLDAAKEELFNLRFQLATGQLDNPMRVRQVRHDIARLVTVLRERELGIAEPAPAAPKRRRARREEEPAAPAEAEAEAETEQEVS